jgi:hypothetical protein
MYKAPTIRTVKELYAWIEAHSDREFERLYDAEPKYSESVQAHMHGHMDYLIEASSAALYRAETRFGA